MTRSSEHFLALDDDQVEPFRPTPGFFAFIGLACLPALAAVAVFFGAWMVADEVHAAEAGNSTTAQADGVDPWKKTLVGLCPVH